LAAVFGIVAGVSGATGGSDFVLTAGVAGAVASALSMATGAFLAERSELEVAEANVDRERREIADRQAQDPDALLRVLTQEELGGIKTAGSPVQSALAAGISTGIGAIVPVL